ncbi:hypothetical protein RRF57_010119 [Xylaria bambusicola]|uniref:Uncharacterized protein n=1 Tax=Xylaria bambusicola TaxID=326684 RepID=A0AAN7UXT1_9PEZI
MNTTDSYPESPLPPSSPQDLAYTSPRSSGKKRLIRPSTPPRTSSRHATWVIPDVPNKLLPTRTLRRKQKRSSLRLVETSPQSINQPIFTMSSPVKTSPPTALDRNFGSSDNSLSAPSLPMPGLSGRANSSTGNLLKGPIDDDGKLKSAALLSTSPPASEVTSSWGFTRCGFHKQPGVPASHDNDNIKGNKKHDDALITGLFFLGGEKSDNGSEFQYGNIRVHLQTSSQGFVIGAGRESVSVLRITLRFTVDFMDEKDFGLDLGFENTKKKKEQNATQGNHGEQGMKHGDGGKGQQEHSLSLSLTMTITIMAINSSSLS